jgi:uncharacterized damage-inducible protein DinB
MSGPVEREARPAAGEVALSDGLARTIVERFAAHNDRLRRAVAGLTPQALDRALGPDTNSMAVLVAHVTGSELGWLHLAAGRPFERDRDAEFRTAGKTAADLERMIDRADVAMPDLVRGAIAGGLGTARRTRDGKDVTAGYALVHALEHLAEHVGQLELTRQLVRGEA